MVTFVLKKDATARVNGVLYGSELETGNTFQVEEKEAKKLATSCGGCGYIVNDKGQRIKPDLKENKSIFGKNNKTIEVGTLDVAGIKNFKKGKVETEDGED